MTLVTEELRVAPTITRLSLKAAADITTPTLPQEVISILHHDLCTKSGVADPHILMYGFNPYAGGGGYTGTEEMDTIIPVLGELRVQGIELGGPLPADTLFQPKYLDHTDTALAMYHD